MAIKWTLNCEIPATLVLVAFSILTATLPSCVAQSPGSNESFSSDDYQNLVEAGVRELVRSNGDAFKKLMSPSMLARSEKELGPVAVEKIIMERFVPFFRDFNHLDPNFNTTKTTDAGNHKGLAIYRSFFTQPRDGRPGDERPFVMFVLEEDGKLVIGNLLINKTLRDATVSPR